QLGRDRAPPLASGRRDRRRGRCRSPRGVFPAGTERGLREDGVVADAVGV
ncbi:MAG: Aspartate carbamoyltransferase, partial [uncultured Thermomicrobiales bacterium]